MKKILMLVVIIVATSTAAGCACGYSSCTACNVTSVGCCGSNGWY